MRKTILWILLPLVICFCGCKVEQGSGNVITKTRIVGEFESISIIGPGEVLIVQGEPQGVSIEAEDNVLPLIRTSVSEKTLVLEAASPGKEPVVLPTKPIRVTITAKVIKGLALSGSALIRAKEIKTDTLKLDMRGSGGVTIAKLEAKDLEAVMEGSGICSVSGTVENQKLVIAGSGDFRAKDLASNAALVQISGSGAATCRVAGTLDVSIAGSGTFNYHGTPRIFANVSGSGQIRAMDKNTP